MYKKILVPLEGTENDKVILEHVRHLAKNVGAAVVLMQLQSLSDNPLARACRVGSRIGPKKSKKRLITY
jgi:nucleotide-binding universal stress UspA family protein